MSMIKAFSVYDKGTLSFGVPFFARAVGEAVRSFSSVVLSDDRSGRNSICMYPEDFDLYVIGEFSDDDGTFISHNPELIARASEIVQRRYPAGRVVEERSDD